MRPTLLTDELSETICGMVRAGQFLETAASKAGVTGRSAYGWVARGLQDIEEQQDTVFARFARSVESAREEAAGMHVTRITEASDRDWRASAWLLEKMMPKRFGPKQKIDVKVLRPELAAMSDDQLEEQIKRVEARLVSSTSVLDDDGT